MAKSRRSKARQVALQMLYQRDLNPDANGIRAMIDEELDDPASRAFAWELFAGVMEYRAMLDEKIEAAAENWTLSRMAPTDRNVLRIGAFELLHTETPDRVVIDEAIELARKFGSAQSPQFVNGLLDRMLPNDSTESGTPTE